MGEAEISGVLSQRIHLLLRYRILYGLVLVVGGCVVVWHAEDMVWTKALEAATAHPLKSLWAGHLVAVKAVNIQLSGSVLHYLHYMSVPYLVK